MATPATPQQRKDERVVIGYFIATGDPPAPNANDKHYRGSFLSDAEKREKARRIEREPLPIPPEHGKHAAYYVKNNIAGYDVREERIGDIYSALVPFDNRLLVLGRIYDHPEGHGLIERAKQGIAIALSPYSESLVLKNAQGEPINMFNLHTTHYGATILPEFSKANMNGDHRKGTYIHQVMDTEDGVLQKVRELHLRDGIYVTPGLQDKLGLDDVTRQRLQREFEDGIRIKRALYQKIHGEPMMPDQFDQSLERLYVEPTIELTDAIPVKDTVGASVEALLEARHAREAEEAARQQQRKQVEGEEETGDYGMEEEAGDGDAMDVDTEEPGEVREEVKAASTPAEEQLEAPVLPPEPHAPNMTGEKLNSSGVGDTPALGGDQLLQAPERAHLATLAFAHAPNLEPITTASSIMNSNASTPTSTTSPPPQEQQQQRASPTPDQQQQKSAHQPFRAPPAGIASQAEQQNDNAMDIDEPDASQQQPQQPATGGDASQMSRDEVMKRLAEISENSKLLASGDANLDPSQAYQTMVTLNRNLNVVTAWLAANGMEPDSLDNEEDYTNFMNAKRNLGRLGRAVAEPVQQSIKQYDPNADVSMYAPSKILDPHGSGFRPDQYAMVSVNASNVFSGKRLELESKLAQQQQKAQVVVDLQRGSRMEVEPNRQSVWGAPAPRAQSSQPPSSMQNYQPVSLKRRLPDQNLAQSHEQEYSNPHAGAVFQGEAKRLNYAPVQLQSRSQQFQQQQQNHEQQQRGPRPLAFDTLNQYLSDGTGIQMRTGSSVASHWRDIHAKENPTLRADRYFTQQYVSQSSQTIDPALAGFIARVSGKISPDDSSYAEQLLSDHQRFLRSNPNQKIF